MRIIRDEIMLVFPQRENSTYCSTYGPDRVLGWRGAEDSVGAIGRTICAILALREYQHDLIANYPHRRPRRCLKPRGRSASKRAEFSRSRHKSGGAVSC